MRGSALRVVLVAAGVASAALWSLGIPPGRGTGIFAVRAMALFALQLAAIGIAWRRDDRRTLVVLVLFALVFRVLAWTWPPELSSDLHRYLWDGRVQAAGVSPYAHAPDAPELARLRDRAVWPRINRPGAVTVYPPGAQFAFRLLHAAGGRTVGHVKAAAALADLGVLALLALALRRNGFPRGRLAIHAWSPLVISETCVSGHLDALVVLLIVAALLLLAPKGRGVHTVPLAPKGRGVHTVPLAPEGRGAGVRGWLEAKQPWTGLLLGAATACKLYPALLLAALPPSPRGRGAGGEGKKIFPRTWLAAAAVVAVAYLAYGLSAGVRVLGFLPDYVRSGEDFNEGLRALLEWSFALLAPERVARPLAMALCAIALAAVTFAIARRAKASPDVWTSARDLALAFVLLLPTAVHPWYALWLVPLLVLRPSLAGIWIAGLLPLSYLKYVAPGEVMPTWVLVVEWLPAFALLAAERLHARAPLRAAPEVA